MIIEDFQIPALINFKDQVMILLGLCFCSGYHITVPWGIEALADKFYRQSVCDFLPGLATMDLSFNEAQDQSILAMAGEYRAWWLDEATTMNQITSDLLTTHFEMYLKQVWF